MLLILKVLLESEGDYWPSLNGPFTETPSPEAPVSVKQIFAHVDAPGALWEGDFFFISFRFGTPLFLNCDSNRGASWVPTPNPLLFL